MFELESGRTAFERGECPFKLTGTPQCPNGESIRAWREANWGYAQARAEELPRIRIGVLEDDVWELIEEIANDEISEETFIVELARVQLAALTLSPKEVSVHPEIWGDAETKVEE